MFHNIKKEDLWTIPNLMTYLRIILIPFFIYFYFKRQMTATLVVVALSALSDLLDGWVARTFNMVTELGTALDPLADKLNQAALLFCAAEGEPILMAVFITHVLKEIVTGFTGMWVLRETGHFYPSKWYGKALTWVLYITGALVLIARAYLPGGTVMWIGGFCLAFLLYCFIRYEVRYVRIVRAFKSGGIEAAQAQADC